MSEQNKPSSYINIAADITLLQRIICCNHDIQVTPADTPRNGSKTPSAELKAAKEEIEIAIQENLSPGV